MPHDIFISYSRKNLDAVKPIKEELEAHGLSCWMDLEGIESGSEEFTDHLVAAIDASVVLLFFLSDSSQKSEWSLKEIRFAKRKQKRIVLVRFNDDQMTDSFDFNFGGADIIDWRRLEQKAKLLRDLQKWTVRAAQPQEDETPLPLLEHASHASEIQCNAAIGTVFPKNTTDEDALRKMRMKLLALLRTRAAMNGLEERFMRNSSVKVELMPCWDIYAIAYKFQRGIGCEKDEDEAERLFKIAYQKADELDARGHPGGTLVLARCLANGYGTEKDLREAFANYRNYIRTVGPDPGVEKEMEQVRKVLGEASRS